MNPPVDVLVIGAQKSGTSTLWAVLRRQDWFLGPPMKELHHFDARRPDPDEAYRSRFPAASRPGQLRGEATPEYLSTYEAPARIHAHNPDVRLVAILRDPVDRAVSAFAHARRVGAIRCHERFADVYRDEAVRRVTHRGWTQVRWGGMYGHHLLRYLDIFPRDQLHVIFFEELVAQPSRVLGDLWAFLGRDGAAPRRLPHANPGRDTRFPIVEAGLARVERSGLLPHDGRPRHLLRRTRLRLSRPATPVAVDETTLGHVRKDYAADTALLEELVGRRPPWSRVLTSGHSVPAGGHRAQPDARLSVVVATRGPSGLLRAMLCSLNEAVPVGSDVEVLVVVDGPEERADLDLHGLTLPITVLHTGRRSGPARARNLGARAGTGTTIAFLDDDVIVPVSWLSDVRGVLDGPWDLLGGALGSVHARNIVSQMFESLVIRHARFEGRWHLSTANVLVRRSAFERLGGFDERFPDAAGEDWDLSRRAHDAGLVVDATTAFSVHHWNPERLRHVVSRARRYARSTPLGFGGRRRGPAAGDGSVLGLLRLMRHAVRRLVAPPVTFVTNYLRRYAEIRTAGHGPIRSVAILAVHLPWFVTYAIVSLGVELGIVQGVAIAPVVSTVAEQPGAARA